MGIDGARRCKACQGVLAPHEAQNLYCGPCGRVQAVAVKRRAQDRRSPPPGPVRRCRVCFAGIDHKYRNAIYCGRACSGKRTPKVKAPKVGRKVGRNG